VKIKGATHEFTTLPGVLEDIADIILNIKTLVIKSYTSEPKTMTLKSSKKGAVTAGMIECDSSIEIINKDLVIATLTDDVEFDIEFTIETSRGYVPAEELAAGEQELGVIEVDAFFSPVTRVRYRTEDTRVGQKTNYDKLIMEIWTNGTITPEMALVESGKILRKHLNPFVQYFEMGQQIPEGGMIETGNEVDEELNRKLGMSVQELELSVRASNCLESAQIETVGQLVKMAESELLKIRSFGKTSLREIKRKLADLGLSLGMNVELPQPEATVAAEGE